MSENDKNIFTCTGELLSGVGDRIRLARKNEKRLSQGLLADIVGLSTNTINRYERNHRSPTIDEVTRIGEALGCDPCWLLTGMSCFEQSNAGTGIPIQEDVAAGDPPRHILVPEIESGTFSVKMNSDEMSPRIHQGDWLVLDVSETSPGDVVALLDEWGGHHVRWVREVDGQPVFVAENSAYNPISVNAAKIIGKVVSVIHVDKY
jgi:SOS-response transcriptional repressor LexA